MSEGRRQAAGGSQPDSEYKTTNLKKLFILIVIVVATVSVGACSNVTESTNSNATGAGAENKGPAAAGKIPITTSSEEARKAFLEGRDLNEKLRIQDSIAHFDKAISLDPNLWP